MGKSLLFANFAYICNLNKHQDEKTVLSLLALCCSCTIWAEDSMLTFRLNDGVNSEVSYKIGTDINRIVFKGNTVVLQKGEKVVKSYAESLVSSFSFGNTANGITMPELGTDDAASTAVYAIDGKRLGSLQTIKTLPKGVYIIRKGNVSYKIVKTD